MEEGDSIENDNITHNNNDDHSAMLEYEDDGNSTIYHVPSFLLKTYEIVDVSALLKFNSCCRIKNTIRLWLGLQMANHL